MPKHQVLDLLGSGNPLEQVNEWNMETRYGKVYVDGDGDLVLEYDVNLRNAIQERSMEDHADLWVSLIDRVQSRLISH